MINIDDLIDSVANSQLEPCYPKRIAYLKETRGWNTALIDNGISKAVSELEHGTKSFVIYGEPQSGKTEFMIALVCKLLDMGKQTIFVVMNDNRELEEQNFDRFHRASQMSTTPLRDYQLQAMSEPELKSEKQRVIFCRKNSKNLAKLIQDCRFMKDRVIIDDEADYATPNTRINKSEVTAINDRVGELGDLTRQLHHGTTHGDGVYIGVTATPARLDLNNTYFNDSRRWIFLESHKEYKGRAFFFPSGPSEKSESNYQLVKLPAHGDNPKLLRHAVYRFLARAALLNIKASDETQYSMLIHTAGKTNDHKTDQIDLQKILTTLSNKSSPSYRTHCTEFAKVIEDVVDIHKSAYTVQEIFLFVLKNITRHEILVINHKNDSTNVQRACRPNALFTFAIGGNIVSRGLTFERLLSFYFSRNVKGKLQQNTYIQRARMFGDRPYSEYFELCVPEQLFSDWADCFNDHELSLRLARAGAYQHVQGPSSRVVDSGAIDTANVTVEKHERAVGDKFKLTDEVKRLFLEHDQHKPLSFLYSLIETKILSGREIPETLLAYVKEASDHKEDRILIVLAKDGIQRISKYTDGDEEAITRKRGGIIHAMLNKTPQYDHNNYFFLPIQNTAGEARILFKEKSGKQIIQNLRVQKPIS